MEKKYFLIFQFLILFYFNLRKIESSPTNSSNETIIYKASRSNYIGLTNDLVITQEALSSMNNRDIVFCLSGYTLSFAENAIKYIKIV